MAKRHTLARMAAGVSSFAIVAVMAMSPTLASAQNVNNDKDKDKNGTVSEVVVTAQFTQQNLQQTPIAITAVTGAMLDARGQTRISDITAQAPNVQLQQNPAGGGNSMRAFIRGVGQADQDPAVDPGVGIYVDDVYFASVTGSVFDLLDLDRVEILRGPQGTLSGMNSLGGSVKLYSKKPTGEGGFVEASTGSLHRTDVRGSADFTVVPDKLFMRISGVSRHHDGYVTRLDYACVHPNDPYVISGALPRGNSGSDCKIGTQGNQDMTAVRGALRWTPNSNVEVNLIGDYTNDDSETQAATLLKTGEIIPGGSLAYQGVPYDDRYVPYGPFRGDTVINDPYVSYANFNSPGTTYKPIDTAGNPGVPNGAYSPEPKDGIQSWGVSNTIDWRLLEKLSLKSITGYRHYVAESTDDNDGSPVDELLEEAKFTHKQFSEELRLNGQAFGDKVDYTVGGIYFYQKTIYAAREHDPFIAGIYGTLAQPTFDFLQDDPTVVKTEAAFAHAIWSITDKLSLASGIRYTHEHKDYTFYRLNLDGQTPFLILSDPANPLNGRTGTFAGSHVDYRADLSYQVTDDVMTYAQFSTGFKGGGISPRPYFPQQILGFGPEKLQAYEVGLKSQLFEHRLRVNLAAFYNDYKDYQATPNVCVDASGNPLPLPYGTPGLCGQYLNVANAKVKGAEAEVEAHPIPGMTIDGSFSYLDFKFGKPFISTNAVVQGGAAPGIGKVKWSVGAQYVIPFIGDGTLTPRLDLFHTPGYCGNLACDPLVSNTPYNLLNGRLTYRPSDEDWSLSLEVTNLTDKLYYLNKFASTYTEGQPGMPREWSVTVRRNF